MAFEIIKHAGDPKKATLPNGTVVRREEELFVPEWGVFVPCAPYDNHFVYHNPTPGQSAYMCTCGSVAVITPPDGRNGMFVCLFDATYGNHQTTYINKKDFDKVAGRTLEIKGTRARIKDED